MSLILRIIGTAERTPIPDVMIRASINTLCLHTATKLAVGNAETDAAFAHDMAARAIAEHIVDANAQHFFTGGVMPSHHLIRQYADLLVVDRE